MKYVVSLSVLLLGLLLAGCNPVRPLPAGTSGEATATVGPSADVSTANYCALFLRIYSSTGHMSLQREISRNNFGGIG